jgi:DNA-binding transcriptional ArsR family regulator
MEVKTVSSPFGGRARTRILVALSLLGSSFPRELSRLLTAPVSAVSRALYGLERDALVAGRLVGRTRVFTLNPAYFAKRELLAYLERLADGDTALLLQVESLRRRPRRSGKPL